MSADITTTMKEGDIYRWTYRESGNDRDFGRYHCCSRIAIVQPDGRLRDTFWSSGSDGRFFGADDLPRLDLTFLGNLSDLDKEPEWKADYYDDADIVNLNHSNSSRDNFFLRKGAKRSAAKMMETAIYRLEKAQSDEKNAVRRADELRKVISQIESGQIDNLHL